MKQWSNSERVANYVKNLMNRGETVDEAVSNALIYFFPDINDIPRYRR